MEHADDRDRPLVRRFSQLLAWDRWMGAQGLSDATRKRYRGWVIRFINDCAVPLDDANEAHVEAFLRAPQVMQRARAAPPTRPAERSEAVEAFRTFFRWSRASGVR